MRRGGCFNSAVELQGFPNKLCEKTIPFVVPVFTENIKGFSTPYIHGNLQVIQCMV